MKQVCQTGPKMTTPIRPLKDGVIADFIVTEEMIKHFTKKCIKKMLLPTKIFICVSSGSAPVERKAIQDFGSGLGAKSDLLKEPAAAAGGAESTNIRGNWINGCRYWWWYNRNCCYVFRWSCLLRISKSGGGRIRSIYNCLYMRKKMRFNDRGDATAEKIKKEIGTAIPSTNNTFLMKRSKI